MGVRVTTDPPEQATLADRQLSHHFPLSQTQPRPAMASNSSSLGHLQPKQECASLKWRDLRFQGLLRNGDLFLLPSSNSISAQADPVRGWRPASSMGKAGGHSSIVISSLSHPKISFPDRGISYCMKLSALFSSSFTTKPGMLKYYHVLFRCYC